MMFFIFITNFFWSHDPWEKTTFPLQIVLLAGASCTGRHFQNYLVHKTMAAHHHAHQSGVDGLLSYIEAKLTEGTPFILSCLLANPTGVYFYLIISPVLCFFVLTPVLLSHASLSHVSLSLSLSLSLSFTPHTHARNIQPLSWMPVTLVIFSGSPP